MRKRCCTAISTAGRSSRRGAEGSLKAIDAEFGYFGPIGFDIGTAIGNLLLNYCGLPGQLGIRDAAAAREQRLNDIHLFVRTTLPSASVRWRR